MPWSIRGEKRYYYRHVRVGGRRRKVYVGTGTTAEMQAQVDGERHRTHDRERRRTEAVKRRLLQIESAIGDFDRLVQRFVEARLLLAGFYRHERGPWRKRRLSG